MRSKEEVAERFIETLAAMDWEGMTEVVHPDARLRALLPPGAMDESGRESVVNLYRRMFDYAWLELLHSSAEPAMDRLRMTYRVKQTDNEGIVTVAEQLAFCDVAAGQLVAIDLVCSGDRPYVPEAR